MTVREKEQVLYGAEARLASGRVSLERFGAMARGDFADQQASPEALLAAAHATCYASALSSGVQGPLTVRSVCVLEREPSGSEGLGWRVTELRVEVAGEVPEHVLEHADRACPISKALASAVPVRTSVA